MFTFDLTLGFFFLFLLSGVITMVVEKPLLQVIT